MIELQNLLLEQFRFAQNPTDMQKERTEDAMWLYKSARDAETRRVNAAALDFEHIERKAIEAYFAPRLSGGGPNYVSAIKLVREMTGLGLKEAKDWCDARKAKWVHPA